MEISEKYSACFLPRIDLVDKAVTPELSVYTDTGITSLAEACVELCVLLCVQVLLIQHQTPLLQQAKLRSISGDPQVVEL